MRRNSSIFWISVLRCDIYFLLLHQRTVIFFTNYNKISLYTWFFILEILFGRQCLHRYSFDFWRIYGHHHLVSISICSNMHGLNHLPDDADRFGSLNNISSFPLKKLSGSLRAKGSLWRNCLKNQLKNEKTPDWLGEQEGKIILDYLKFNSLADSVVYVKPGNWLFW